MSLAVLTHVWLDEKGVAWVDETNTKVIEIVIDHTVGGWSPDEIHRQHSHLSLSQIHAALTYYFDHRQAMDDEIARRWEAAGLMEDVARKSPAHQRLSAIKAASKKPS